MAKKNALVRKLPSVETLVSSLFVVVLLTDQLTFARDALPLFAQTRLAL